METRLYRRPRYLALGAFAFNTIDRQEDPTITNLFAMVITLYPGADPARVAASSTRRSRQSCRKSPRST